jgi:hypothetical protein
VEFSTYELRGVVRAAGRLLWHPTLPPGRHRAARLSSRAAAATGGLAASVPEAFAMSVDQRVPRSSPIGWHRDAPAYDIVAGLVHLLSSCRLRCGVCVAHFAGHHGTLPRRPLTSGVAARSSVTCSAVMKREQGTTHSFPRWRSALLDHLPHVATRAALAAERLLACVSSSLRYHGRSAKAVVGAHVEICSAPMPCSRPCSQWH